MPDHHHKHHGNNQGQYHNIPYLAKPMTKKRYRKTLKAATKLQFGPEQRQIKAERRTSRVQSRHVRDWFSQYGDAVGAAQKQTAGVYQQAQQSVADTSASAANYAEMLRKSLAHEEQHNAQLRGATYDPSGSYTGAAANEARQNATSVLSGVLGAQGASQSAYLIDKGRIGEREKVEQLLTEQSRRRSYNADLRDLAQRKGSFATDLANQMRGSERDFYLGLLNSKNSRKNAKLSARVSSANSRRSAATSRANSKRTAQSSARNRRQDARQFRRTHKHGHTLGTRGGGSSSSGPGGEHAQDKRNVHSAILAGVKQFGHPNNPKQVGAMISWVHSHSDGADISLCRRMVEAFLHRSGGGHSSGGGGPQHGPGHLGHRAGP